jgi:hypothetical protein
MQPQPLIRILANPALDYRSDRLHRALDVDLPGGVAYGRHFLRELCAETMIPQADNPHAVYGAFDLPQQAGECRIGLGLAAEERDIDAIGKVLVDQDRHMLSIAQGFRHLERGVTAGRNQRPHFHRAQLFDDPVGGSAVGPPKQDRSVEPVGNGGDRWKPPIAKMPCKDQRGLAVEPKLRKQLVGTRQDLDPAFFGKRGIVLADMVEMDEFRAQTAEIIPDAGKDCRDFFSDFSGKAAVRLARAIRCSRVNGPIRHVIRPNRFAVLIGSK